MRCKMSAPIPIPNHRRLDVSTNPKMSSPIKGCHPQSKSQIAGGWIANKFGRKGGLLMNNLIGIVAAMAMVFSKHVTSYELLIIGRYLIGVNCGLNTSLVPMYISEIAPLNLRGGLGTVNQLAVTVGLLTSQVNIFRHSFAL